MFADYVFEMSSAQYSEKILLIDDENLNSRTDYAAAFSAHGFEIVNYADDLSFRLNYEVKLKTSGVKLAIFSKSDAYIPYDIHRRLRVYRVALSSLFPKLNADVLQEATVTDLDLLAAAYPSNFDTLLQRQQTEQYLRIKVYARANVKAYLKSRLSSYVSKTYNKALRNKKKNMCLIFLMIIMQRMVTSSTAAVRQSLERRLAVLKSQSTRLGSLTEIGRAHV